MILLLVNLKAFRIQQTSGRGIYPTTKLGWNPGHCSHIPLSTALRRRNFFPTEQSYSIAENTDTVNDTRDMRHRDNCVVSKKILSYNLKNAAVSLLNE